MQLSLEMTSNKLLCTTGMLFLLTFEQLDMVTKVRRVDDCCNVFDDHLYAKLLDKKFPKVMCMLIHECITFSSKLRDYPLSNEMMRNIPHLLVSPIIS